MSFRTWVLLGLLGAMATPAKAANSWGPWVSPEDQRLLWHGRIAFDSGEAVLSWAQSGFEAEISGPALAFRLKPGDNEFNVWVDGVLMAIVGPETRAALDWEQERLRLVARQVEPGVWEMSGLPKGRHRLALDKRTSANFGVSRFGGLKLKGKAQLGPAPKALARRLEFVGDSLTNGYGAEGPGKQCSELRPYENSAKSWVCLASKALKADFQIVALSGYGVVRNYGDKKKASADPMAAYYDRASSVDKDSRWDRARFIPDLVVINLGTNDHSTQPMPDEADFIDGYLKLIAQVLKGREKTPLILGQPLWSGTHAERVAKVLELAKGKGWNVEMLPLQGPAESEYGCDWHPLAVVHQRWAAQLEQVIRARLSWQD